MIIRSMLITLFTFLACSFPVFADSDAQDDKDALKAFKASDVVSKIHNSAYGYAIFPNIGKGGFGIGAAHGSGRVYKGGQKNG